MNLKQLLKCFSATLVLVFLSISGLYAQQRTITGKVINQQTGEPLEGVSVNVKGTNRNVISGNDGSFTIAVPSANAVLAFSYVGFAPQEVRAGRSPSLSVSLTPGANRLDEVVVIGYGIVKRRDLTGAVSSIKAADIVQTPTFNAVEAMQGRVSGVDITRSSGAAGASSNISIRGNRTIRTDPNAPNPNQPLYVIDGYQGGNINDLNPNDIESIEILKDASSTAIYGAQGANGVVIVTTKKGTTGRIRVSYDAFYGINGYTSYPHIRLGEDYIKLRREAYRTAGQWSSPADDPAVFPAPGEYAAVQAGQWIDWFDLLNRNGTQQSHTVSIRSGSDKTKAFLSLGYFREEGMLRRNDFTRFSARFNLDQTIFKWFKAGLLSQVSYTNLNTRTDPLSRVWSTAPLGVPYDSAGNINLYPVPGNTNALSPLTDERGDLVAQNNTIRTNVMANAYVEVAPVKGLTIRSNLGTNLNFSRQGIFNAATSLAQQNNPINFASVTDAFNRYFNWDNIVTYNKQLNDHSFTLTGVISYLQSDVDNLAASGTRQLLASQGFENLSATQQDRTLSSGYVGYNNLSFAGRLNYSYKGKYLLTLSERADGASRLAPGHKWDYFPSAALGWNIGDENFLKDAGWLDNLKLRASWGRAGNYAIVVYGTQSLIVPATNIGFGDVQVNMYQFNPLIGNNNLKWETSATTNLGLDFGILHNRVSGALEWYHTKTSDILLQRTLPRSTGVGSVYQNIAETQNRGVELSLNTRNIVKGDFKWNSTITFTRNHEEITKLIDTLQVIIGSTPETNSLLLGHPISSFYSYRKLGIWQSDKAALASRYKFGATAFKPGDIMVEDINGDSLIDTKDRVYLGSAVPKFVLGFQNTFTYKSFDLSIFLFWRYGQMMNAEFLGRYNPSGEGSGPVNLDYWTPENPTNDFPRPNLKAQLINYPAYQALNFIDGSYFKIKNITLGYTFPQSIKGKIGADNLRLYVTGNNLFTKAKSHLAKNYDPERGGSESSPLSRQFVFGLNVGF